VRHNNETTITFPLFLFVPFLYWFTSITQQHSIKEKRIPRDLRELFALRKIIKTGGIYSFKIFQMETIENLMVSISYTVL
jgi:hypothetical protein